MPKGFQRICFAPLKGERFWCLWVDSNTTFCGQHVIGGSFDYDRPNDEGRQDCARCAYEFKLANSGLPSGETQKRWEARIGPATRAEIEKTMSRSLLQCAFCDYTFNSDSEGEYERFLLNHLNNEHNAELMKCFENHLTRKPTLTPVSRKVI